jgi:ATP-binding cassette subfamily B protein
LIQRATSDIDTIRRFFADQAIEAGRIVMLFVVNFIAIYLLDWRLAWFSIIIVPIVMVISVFFFRRVEKAYEAYQNAGSQALQHAAGELERRARGQSLRAPGI